jgi:hypothetical protein
MEWDYTEQFCPAVSDQKGFRGLEAWFAIDWDSLPAFSLA